MIGGRRIGLEGSRGGLYHKRGDMNVQQINSQMQGLLKIKSNKNKCNFKTTQNLVTLYVKRMKSF